MRISILTGLILTVILGVCNARAAESIWTARETRILRSLQLPDVVQPPESPSNRVADDPTAIAFGKALFFDKRLSRTGDIACGTCHQPEKFFTDGLPRSVGLKVTGRNAPTVVGSSHNSWFYWDGRRDTLWAQALIPFEAPSEMGSSRLAVVRIVGTDSQYREFYASLFGEFPKLALHPELPVHAGPIGEPTVRENWKRIPARDQMQINRAYSNIGKSIAAFERTLQPKPARFDRYVNALVADGEKKAAGILSDDEIKGAKLFINSRRTQCLQCHNGAHFSNGGFHNIGSGTFSGEHLDLGRVFGLRAVLMDEFNCLGPYSDAKAEQCLELRFLNKDSHIPLEGAFKVPGLRNLKSTTPYFHDGRYSSLEAVVNHYIAVPATNSGMPHELRSLQLSETEVSQLVAFLNSLSE